MTNRILSSSPGPGTGYHVYEFFSCFSQTIQPNVSKGPKMDFDCYLSRSSHDHPSFITLDPI